jgi:hypothetical protein
MYVKIPTEQRASWEANSSSAIQEMSPNFIKPWVQEPATCLRRQPVEYTPLPPNLFL